MSNWWQQSRYPKGSLIMHNQYNLCRKEPKLRFLSISSNSAGRSGLILHTLKNRIDIKLLILVKVLEIVMIYA